MPSERSGEAQLGERLRALRQERGLSIAQVAQSTVISEHACSILMPVLEQVFRWRRPAIRAVLEKSGLRVDAWQKSRTDTVRLAEVETAPEAYAELAFAM